jgi:hypothetical protein
MPLVLERRDLILSPGQVSKCAFHGGREWIRCHNGLSSNADHYLQYSISNPR